MPSSPATLLCSACDRAWSHESAPRWRASLSDDGSGAIVFTCTSCMERRQPAYSLQLEYVDGRWDVAETRLPAPPRAGDVIRLAGDESWRVCGSREVPVRPAGKPPRHVFVCRPALAGPALAA